MDYNSDLLHSEVTYLAFLFILLFLLFDSIVDGHKFSQPFEYAAGKIYQMFIKHRTTTDMNTDKLLTLNHV